MKHLYFLSYCIHNLNRDSMKTSSQKYEYDIAKALSNYINVTIMSYVKDTVYQETTSNLTLIGIKKSRDIVSIVEPDSVLIFYGYDLRVVLSMLYIKKKMKIQVLPFIFDTHKTYLLNTHVSFLKKSIVSLFFNVALCFLNCFDAILLFQNKAAEIFKLKVPYHISKPGINLTDIETDKTCNINIGEKQPDTGEFKVVFAGTLTNTNGISEVLNAFKSLDKYKISLFVYGTGPEQAKVIEESKCCHNINYCGLVDDKTLKEKYRDSNLILNLRDPQDITMQYAFPSKLPEILITGVPLLSTKLIDDAEFDKCVCIIKELSADSIVSSILKVYFNYAEYQNRASHAIDYAVQKYNYPFLAEEMYNFLDSMHKSSITSVRNKS